MSGFTIGVAGATGALGKEILTALERVRWTPERVVPMARQSTRIPFVTFNDQQIAVEDLNVENLDELDLIFLALPADAAIEVGTRALREGVLVIDCSGALENSIAPVIPWVNPHALAEGTGGLATVPAPATILLSSVLAPLVRAGLTGDVEATVLIPASCSGRDGVEELSKQVIALFNNGTPPRRVFPTGLAFDLIPQVGLLNSEGWTHGESRIRDELQQMLGIEVTATMVQVPVFTGVSAQISLASDAPVIPGLVEKIIQDGGVRMAEGQEARTVPRPRRVDGQAFAWAGRVRIDEESQTLRMWASMDNLRGAATVAVGLAGVMLQA